MGKNIKHKVNRRKYHSVTAKPFTQNENLLHNILKIFQIHEEENPIQYSEVKNSRIQIYSLLYILLWSNWFLALAFDYRYPFCV